MFAREKSPQDEIKEIDEKFRKQIPGLNENFRRKEKKIIYYLLPIFLLVAGSALLFLLFPTKEEKSHKKEKAEAVINKEEQKTVIKKTREKQKKVLCIVKVPFDSDVMSIAAQKGISDFRINTRRTKEKVIKFFVGDFANIEDTAFVSARLNEKGIPNSVAEKNGKWRVYINIQAHEVSKTPIKKITKRLLEHLRKIMEKKTGEIVNVEVVEEEKSVSTAIFEFQDRRSCRKFFSTLRAKGKKSKIEFYVEAKYKNHPSPPLLLIFSSFHDKNHSFISNNSHPISFFYM